MRNVIALTKVLQERGLEIKAAENGRIGVEMASTTSDLSLVLMDIMMPEMDGFEAIQEIRKNPRLKSLPIIALTAKAMKEDRVRCINAGANDYIAKPINVDKLLSLMRVWLFK
jgi:CheY-like chemotaxis protein